MKLIKSIVRPNKVDEVRDALEKLGIGGVTVTEVRGHGKQKGHTAVYRGKEYNVNLLPKMEVEVVVEDNIADDAIKAIIQAARMSPSGCGGGSKACCTRPRRGFRPSCILTTSRRSGTPSSRSTPTMRWGFCIGSAVSSHIRAVTSISC